MRQYTETTHTSAATLEQELKQVAQDGYALDREEFHEGMVAIAVPVFDSRRRYVAALATHGPKQRFNVEDAMTRRSLLVESRQNHYRNLWVLDRTSHGVSRQHSQVMQQTYRAHAQILNMAELEKSHKQGQDAPQGSTPLSWSHALLTIANQ